MESASPDEATKIKQRWDAFRSSVGPDIAQHLPDFDSLPGRNEKLWNELVSWARGERDDPLPF